jgi:benzoyl-CoA reductase/2-hydroxyglutaryl-CoA dehydratase subunit BcrC/BadD/HgdB
MEIPQMKRERDRVLWLEEVKDFKKKMEEVSGKTISTADITKATKVMNAKRKALQRLNALRAHSPAPISGKDALLIEQIAFYDDPVRFAEKLNALCDELDQRVREGNGVAPKTAPRIMVSGTPMALPNWKVHNLIENAGGIVVNEESCIGTRYFKDGTFAARTNMPQRLGHTGANAWIGVSQRKNELFDFRPIVDR